MLYITYNTVPNSLMISALGFEASVLLSIHSFSELYVFITWTDIML